MPWRAEDLDKALVIIFPFSSNHRHRGVPVQTHIFRLLFVIVYSCVCEVHVFQLKPYSQMMALEQIVQLSLFLLTPRHLNSIALNSATPPRLLPVFSSTHTHCLY